MNLFTLKLENRELGGYFDHLLCTPNGAILRAGEGAGLPDG